jgi:hypothetical protein
MGNPSIPADPLYLLSFLMHESSTPKSVIPPAAGIHTSSVNGALEAICSRWTLSPSGLGRRIYIVAIVFSQENNSFTHFLSLSPLSNLVIIFKKVRSSRYTEQL